MDTDKKNMNIKDYILTAINGALIGIANIIPGVSGGTFALILGIFDRMVEAINSISITTIKVVIGLFTGGFKAKARHSFAKELKRIDALFLAIIVLFAGISAMALSFLMEYLLSQQTVYTLAFFIGLIVPSITVPWAMMDKYGWRIVLIIPGVVLTAGIGLVMPDNSTGIDNPFFAAFSGAIAISAMILPGISGSFVLLVMGQYQNFIAKITGFLSGLSSGSFNMTAFIWLAAFAIGMGVGIIAFSKLLAWLLKKARSATMAFLIGLLLGSLFILWPFKDLSQGARVIDRHGEIKQDVQIATAQNRMPVSTGEGTGAAFALIAGLAGSAGLMSIGKKRKQNLSD